LRVLNWAIRNLMGLPCSQSSATLNMGGVASAVASFSEVALSVSLLGLGARVLGVITSSAKIGSTLEG
jgi:hypothetical protein